MPHYDLDVRYFFRLFSFKINLGNLFRNSASQAEDIRDSSNVYHNITFITVAKWINLPQLTVYTVLHPTL